MSLEKGRIVWVVVLVESGVPLLSEVYLDETTARVREQILRKDINPDYDEVGLFEVEVGVPQDDY